MVKNYFRFAFALVFIFLLVSPAMETYAADPEPWVIEVDDFSDAPDAVHNSVCDTVEPEGVGGVCTLRAAIDEANKCPATAGGCEEGVKILVPPGTYTLTIPPVDPNDNSSGDLNVYNTNELLSYVIEGTDPANPPVINGNDLDRVLRIDDSSTTITLRNLVIRGGNLAITEGDYQDKNGAGISNRGNLILENVVIENNQITCFPDDFKQCYTGVGGGLFSSNQLTMNTSTVRNNSAIRGGGIFYNNSVVQMKIFNSTISGNEAVTSGGGIANYGWLMMQNSTVSNNVSSSVGGIWNDHTMNLYNVTVASNSASLNNGSGTNLVNAGTLTISNSIIAYPISPYASGNCSNSDEWTALGNNMYSDSSCNPGVNDFPNTDPKLTPLAWLGGSTMTRGLLQGSPAHDAGTNFCLGTMGVIVIDQRGENRDSLCDLGAFEGVAYGVYLPAILR